MAGVRARSLAWVLVALAFADLVFFSGASNFLASPQSRILNQVLIGGAILVAGLLALRQRADLRSTLLLPGAAWLAANTLSAIFSQRPAASLEALALLLLCAPGYLVVRAIVRDPGLRLRTDWLVVLSTAVFVIAYLAQAFTQWATWWSVAGPSLPPLRPGDVGLTVGTVNAVALYLELLAPIAIWLSWDRWRSRPATAGLAVLAIAALVVTGSRGAWLGAAAGAVVVAVLAWRTTGLSLRASLSTTARRLIAIVATTAGLALVPVVVSRMLSGDAGRIELWSAAWSMFGGSPLVGVGPGAWPGVRATTAISDDNLAVLATSHSSILQVLSETGLIGALAIAWLTIVAIRITWRAIRLGQATNARTEPLVIVGSLVAAGTHSLVDTQFHLPAIVLLILYLVARLERLATPEGTATEGPSSPRFIIGTAAAVAAIGAVLLVPIDIAMVRAAAGNAALDRGDAVAALAEYDGATAWHDLPPYRVGQAIARRSIGDDAGAADALAAAGRAEPFTFVLVQEASLRDDPAALWDAAVAAGPYDPTASVNLAAHRHTIDPTTTAHHLAAAMVQVPPLVYSARPEGLFDAETWTAAQAEAIGALGKVEPVQAAALATLAGRADDAAAYRSAVPAGPESDALDLLSAAVAGRADLDAAHVLLRRAPGSIDVHFVLWHMGFRVESQTLIDAVQALAVPLYFNVPMPPMELVVDGRVDADYSLRLPRWPMASAGRNGPKRPYIDGFITIEPVYRPKP